MIYKIKKKIKKNNMKKEEKKFYPLKPILVYYIGVERISVKDTVKYFNKQKKQFKYDTGEVNQIFVLDETRNSTIIEILNQ